MIEIFQPLGMSYDKYLKERNERAKRRISLYTAQVGFGRTNTYTTHGEG